MELNVKRFNLNEAAAWVRQQGARRRHGAAVQAAEILLGGQGSSLHCSPRVLPACLPARLPAAVVQCQMQMSRGSRPGFLRAAPPTSLSCGLSVQLDAVLLELSAQQSVVVLQLLDLKQQQQTGDISETLLSGRHLPSSQPPQRKPGWVLSENKKTAKQSVCDCVCVCVFL